MDGKNSELWQNIRQKSMEFRLKEDDPYLVDKAATHFIQCLKRLMEIAEEEKQYIKPAPIIEKEKLGLKQQFLDSDSSDSKYSNEDRNDKDHLLVGEEAILRSMKKLKNANKIVQRNEMINKDSNTSHIVHYFNEINKKMIVPKGLGMIHRKNPLNEINLKEQPLTDDYADAFSNALGRAKFIDSIALNYTQLNDEKAI